MAKFEERPFEPSPLMITRVSDIEEKIAALRTQIESLGHEKSKLVSEEARSRAQLKVDEPYVGHYGLIVFGDDAEQETASELLFGK